MDETEKDETEDEKNKKNMDTAAEASEKETIAFEGDKELKKKQDKKLNKKKDEKQDKKLNKKKDEKQDKKQDEKQRKPFWITRSVAEDFGREELLRTIFHEFIVYFFFVTLVTLYITGMHMSSAYYLTNGLLQQFVLRGFGTLNGAEITFEDVKTAADVWFYLEDHMLGSFFWESTYGTGNDDENVMNILGENKVLGVPRLRQVKVRNDSCVIHEYFRRLFLNCFDAYSAKAEDNDSFGLGSATAWTYSKQEDTKSLTYWGKISKYGGGGFYVDLKNDKNQSFEIIKNLKDNLWITRGTRAIFVDFSVYNANINFFGICKLVFEFPSTGGVISSADFRSLRLLRFHSIYDWFVLFCEICFYGFILFYICEEIRELAYFKWRYFTKFWTYADLSIIFCSLSSGVISLIEFLEVFPAIKLIKENPDKYGNLEYLAFLRTQNNNLFAVNLFFIYMKIFKFLNFNKTMGQLHSTLGNCATDVFGFSIMFFIIFFAFAELGYLLFGSEVENFSSFGISMFTLLRTILGDFDYDEIEKANRFLAPLFFLAYIFLVFFVLLNMFLAIINDTYSDVKTEIAIAPDDMQMSEYLSKGLKNFLRKCGCLGTAEPETKSEINATIRQIRDALKKCGFSDMEIAMFFARYNIDPQAEVGAQDVDKLHTDLDKILREGDGKGGGYVKVNDFTAQQERLEQIDKTISALIEQVKSLLLKLDQMDNVRKVKKT